MKSYAKTFQEVRASYRDSAKHAATLNSGSVLQIYFLKPVSLYMTPIFVWLRATPNQVTWISFVIGLTACVMLAVGLPEFVRAGAWLYLLHRLFDHLDGNLARYQHKTSRYGHFLDASLDIVIQTALLVGAGIGAYRQCKADYAWGAGAVPGGPESVLLAGAVASLFWQLSRHIKLVYNWTLSGAGTAASARRAAPARPTAARGALWSAANLARRSIVPLVRVPGLIVAAHTNMLLVYVGFFAIYFPVAFVMQYARLLAVARRTLRDHPDSQTRDDSREQPDAQPRSRSTDFTTTAGSP